jgi:hypothetical protein
MTDRGARAMPSVETRRSGAITGFGPSLTAKDRRIGATPTADCLQFLMNCEFRLRRSLEPQRCLRRPWTLRVVTVEQSERSPGHGPGRVVRAAVARRAHDQMQRLGHARILRVHARPLEHSATGSFGAVPFPGSRSRPTGTNGRRPEKRISRRRLEAAADRSQTVMPELKLGPTYDELGPTYDLGKRRSSGRSHAQRKTDCARSRGWWSRAELHRRPKDRPHRHLRA